MAAAATAAAAAAAPPENLALVLHEPLRMSLERRPAPPAPGPGQVQLATHTVGICGSDVKYWRCGRIGQFQLSGPMVLGHETSARVTRLGAGVTRLRVGDRVAVEVGLPCARCAHCKRGRYNLCPDMAFAATPPHDGTLSRLFNHPADFCFRLPAGVTFEEGALLEPLAVAVHACQRAPVRPGDLVLVCGAGAVGLLCMLAARAFGAAHVIVTDVLESRLAFARKLGASATLQAGAAATSRQLAEAVREHARRLQPDGLGGVDVALECSGAEASVQLAIWAARAAASIVCVGCQPDSVSIPLNAALMQEVDLKGVFRYRNCYPLALQLVESGRVQLAALVTHRFALEQAEAAFEACFRGEGVKIVIRCSAPDEEEPQPASCEGAGAASNGA